MRRHSSFKRVWGESRGSGSWVHPWRRICLWLHAITFLLIPEADYCLHPASAIKVCMFQELGQAFIGSASAFSPGKWDWHKVHSHLPPELRGKSQFRTEWKTFYPGNWKPASVYLGTEPSVPPKQCAGSYAPGQPSQIGSTWGTHNNSWSSLKSHLATVHKILVLSPSKQ